MEVTLSDIDHVSNVTMFPSSILEYGRVSSEVSSRSGLDDEDRKQRELEEFYATYDVWTGIRTAITLALFFIFTVSVIAYKSRNKKPKQYELYPAVEEAPGETMEYGDYWNEVPTRRGGVGRCYEKGGPGMGSAPLPTQDSVGSHFSLANSFRVKSLPGSVLAMNWSRMSSSEKDDGIFSTAQARHEFLRVPGVRVQSTGSSSDVSTHDLPTDLPVRLGVTANRTRPMLQLGGMDWTSDHATAEWLQTIDINVIQPTPNISPCSSMRSVSGSLDQSSLQPHSRSLSRQSRHEEDDDDFVFCVETAATTNSAEGSGSLKSNSPSSRRTTEPNLLCVTNFPSHRGPSLLGLPTATHLSGSCEKLSIQPLSVSRPDSGASLQAASSIEDHPQMVSFKVPFVRRTFSATSNGYRSSLKVRCGSPVRRADSESSPAKRGDVLEQRKNSSGSTSSTDEASESVSFHLMVPQLSMDCPSQDVSRSSSPSLSPTPPQTPTSSRRYASSAGSRVAGIEGRGVLRRQLARDFTQPLQQLPTYIEEEEPNSSGLADLPALRPPPGYRDPPVPPLSGITFPTTSPSPSPSPIPVSPLFYCLSPSTLSVESFTMPESPIPPPPSPMYSRLSPSPSAPCYAALTRTHSPVARTISPLARTNSPVARAYSPHDKSPVDLVLSPVSCIYSPDARTHSPVARSHSPLSRTHSPVTRSHSPEARTHSPDARTHSPVAHTYLPTSLTHHLITLPHLPLARTDLPASKKHPSVMQTHPPVFRTDQPVARTHSPVTKIYPSKAKVHLPVTRTDLPVAETHSLAAVVHPPVTRTDLPVAETHSLAAVVHPSVTRTDLPVAETHSLAAVVHPSVTRTDLPVAETHSPAAVVHPSVTRTDLPVAETHSPAAVVHPPVTRTDLPVAETHSLAAVVHPPVTRTDLPVAETHSLAAVVHPPVTRTDLPVAETHSLAAVVHPPVTRTDYPAFGSYSTDAKMHASVTRTDRLAVGIHSPNTSVHSHVVRTDQPAASVTRTDPSPASTHKPAARTHAAVARTDPPTARTLAPTARTHAPVTRTHAPVTRIHAPVTRTHVPVTRTHATVTRSLSPHCTCSAEDPPDEGPAVPRQLSYRAMTLISIDEPDVQDVLNVPDVRDVHETSC